MNSYISLVWPGVRLRNTKVEYFWVTAWPSSTYWIIERHTVGLKVVANKFRFFALKSNRRCEWRDRERSCRVVSQDASPGFFLHQYKYLTLNETIGSQFWAQVATPGSQWNYLAGSSKYGAETYILWKPPRTYVMTHDLNRNFKWGKYKCRIFLISVIFLTVLPCQENSGVSRF